jgi:hypothetical protein
VSGYWQRCCSGGRQREPLVGNVVAAGLIAGFVLLFAWREELEPAQIRATCAERNVACRIHATDFSGHGDYGGVEFATTLGVFVIGPAVEGGRAGEPGHRADRVARTV